MSWYCEIAPGHPFHGPYHEHEYGFPLRDESALFERFTHEINQAGLSWLLILKRRDDFRRAFEGFDVDRVASYGAAERRRLLDDPGIIRNRLKIDAVIENAKRIAALRESHGSFAAWLDAHHPLPKADWVKLFKKTFVFTGGEITGEFLLSTGYLPGAHRETCPVYPRVVAAGAAWAAIPLPAEPAAPVKAARKPARKKTVRKKTGPKSGTKTGRKPAKRGGKKGVKKPGPAKRPIPAIRAPRTARKKAGEKSPKRGRRAKAGRKGIRRKAGKGR